MSPVSETATNVGGAQFYRMADVDVEPMSDMLTRQYIAGSQAMFAVIRLARGCVVPEHSHPNEQIAIIVSGALAFTVAGVTQIVRAGEVLVIPGNLPHSALALEDTVDWDLFAPPRQDWIDKDDSYLRQGR